MKYTLIILGFFLVFYLPCFKPTYAIELTNRSFESADEGWIKTSSTVQFSRNTTDTKDASQSAEISYASTTSNGIKQSLTVTPDKSYKISGYIKPTTAKKAFLRLAWYQTGSTNQIKTDDSTLATGSTEWSLVDFTVTAPSAASTAELRLLVSEGTALFDAITIEEYILPTATISPSPTLIPSISATTTSTPVTQTPTPTSTINEIYDKLYISEAFIYPESGQSEWVEIYNANSFQVSLANWYIDDTADSGSLPRSINITIPPHAYTVLEMNSALFNNAGDTIRLLDQNKILKDSIIYTASQKNMSIGRVNFVSNTICIQTPSKNNANNLCVENSVLEDEDETPTPTRIPDSLIMPSPAISLTLEYPIYKEQYYQSQATNPPDHKDYTVTEKSSFKKEINTKPQTTASLLATAYSLLSFLSIAAKMIITRE